MKIEDLKNAPQWLRDADTVNADVLLDEFGRLIWLSGEWRDGVWRDGVWRDGVWRGGEWRDGEWCDGEWCDGEWRGGVWRGGEWRGGVWRWGVWCDGEWLSGEWRDGEWRGGEWRGGVMTIDRKKVSQFRCFVGLYGYRVYSVLFRNGSRWVRMGCLWKSLEDWERIGIRNSNPSEFPDDGSAQSEDRVAAFEFAKAAVLRMNLPKEKK